MVRWWFKQGLISSLTSAFHPKENPFCCYECSVSLMYLGGRRLFATDHLYPSSPGASHHLQHTSHSIRLKVECTDTTHHTHKRCLQLLHLITFPFLASRRTPPDPRPPQSPSLPSSLPLCFTSAPLLLHSPSPVLPRIQDGSVWWMGQHYSCPLLAWFNCCSPSPPHLSVWTTRLSVSSHYVWQGLKHMALHDIIF